MDSRGRAFGELFFPSHLWLGEKHVESRAEIHKKIGLRPIFFGSLIGCPCDFRPQAAGPLRFQRNRRRRSSAVENRLRFSTAEVEKKNRRFFFSRKKDLRSFFLEKKNRFFFSRNRRERGNRKRPGLLKIACGATISEGGPWYASGLPGGTFFRPGGQKHKWVGEKTRSPEGFWGQSKWHAIFKEPRELGRFKMGARKNKKLYLFLFDFLKVIFYNIFQLLKNIIK